ncbi:MAG: hypothetical protein EG823_04415 [Actinobacteria bacterium]|nr:hypothetical protein [Actinomycetota bacterium]
MRRYSHNRTRRALTVIALVVAFTVLTAAPASAMIVDSKPVYRFYNATLGTHFYTDSEVEVADVTAKYSSVFTYEGTAYYTFFEGTAGWEPPVGQEPTLGPLYRFYNKRNGSHFYTTSAQEKDKVIATWPTVYTFEGTAYTVMTAPWEYGPSMPVYRFYNKVNGSHFYTISETERALVQMLYADIYKFEGIAFYAYAYNVFI